VRDYELSTMAACNISFSFSWCKSRLEVRIPESYITEERYVTAGVTRDLLHTHE